MSLLSQSQSWALSTYGSPAQGLCLESYLERLGSRLPKGSFFKLSEWPLPWRMGLPAGSSPTSVKLHFLFIQILNLHLLERIHPLMLPSQLQDRSLGKAMTGAPLVLTANAACGAHTSHHLLPQAWQSTKTSRALHFPPLIFFISCLHKLLLKLDSLASKGIYKPAHWGQ